MTLTKESLRSALDEVDSRFDFFCISPPGSLAVAAARFVERLLPGECPAPHLSISGSNLDWEAELPCPTCHGSGQLWDEGLVEVVAEALHDAPYDGCDSYQQMQVRAVLAALAQEVGKE